MPALTYQITGQTFHIPSGCAQCLCYKKLLRALGTGLPKATMLCKETWAICENQMISSYLFAQHLKQCCTQNSERPLQMPTDEKDGSKKITSSRVGTVSEWALFQWTDMVRTVLCTLRGLTKSGRVRRQGPENEAWSLNTTMTLKEGQGY